MAMDPPINATNSENEGSERCCQVAPDDGERHTGIRNRSFVPFASASSLRPNIAQTAPGMYLPASPTKNALMIR